MILSRTEKEQRVIELYQQGKTVRKISHEVHMSFGDIGAIIRKLTGVDGDKPKEQDKAPNTTLSKDSQAFKLFSQGKKPVDVAIELDIKADYINCLYRKYWELNQLHDLTLVYKKIKNQIPSFLKLHSILRENGMNCDEQKDIANILKYANELPYLENKVQQLMCDIGVLKSKKNNSKTGFFALQKQISEAKDSLKFYQSILDDKIQNIADKHAKLARLENIKNNNKDYQKIERLSEQKANDIFSNKKAILAAAVIAVLAALRNDRNKQQLLIYGSFYPSNDADAILSYTTKMMSSANPENYLQFNEQKLLEIVEQFYDTSLKIAVNNTIYSLSNPATQHLRPMSLK